jgi:thioester reductase-like protein
MGSWSDGDILLTGATGLVGGDLVARLLAAAPHRELICLVRAPDAAALARRRAAIVAWARLDPASAERVRAVAGDTSSPGLGLGAARAALARRVASVVHCAASTRFDLELEDARRVNVGGAAHALAFAREADARLHHVSSTFVAGDPATGAPRNTYEESKRDAEARLREEARGARITIWRPSIIVGDSRTGRTPHFRVLYEPFKWVILGKTGILPCRPDVRLDVVPVDFVCDALVALGDDPATVGAELALASGAADALSIAELVALSEPIVNGWLARRGEPTLPVPRIVSPDDAAPEDAALFALGAQVMRTHVPYMLAEQLFEDARARAALAARGLSCPPLRSYLARLLEYALERRFGTSVQ